MSEIERIIKKYGNEKGRKFIDIWFESTPKALELQKAGKASELNKYLQELANKIKADYGIEFFYEYNQFYKKANIEKLFVEVQEEEKKRETFHKRLMTSFEEQNSRRDALYKAQRFTDEDYGYSLENPICTSSINSTDKYLESLRTLNGDSFTWERIRSISLKECNGIPNVIIDVYELFAPNQTSCVLYICPYGHSSENVPKGMYYVNSQTSNSTIKSENHNKVEESGIEDTITIKEELPFEDRLKLFEAQRNKDENFGYSIKNPICTESNKDTVSYLQTLRSINGESYMWEKIGSSFRECNGVSNVLIEEYKLYTTNQPPFILYISPYGFKTINLPKGLYDTSYVKTILRETGIGPKLRSEAEEISLIYPNFSIDEEIVNSEFRELIINGATVKKAYEEVHNIHEVPNADELLNRQEIKLKDIVSRYKDERIQMSPELVDYFWECSGKLRDGSIKDIIDRCLDIGFYLGVFCKKHNNYAAAIKSCNDILTNQSDKSLSIPPWEIVNASCNALTAAGYSKNMSDLFVVFRNIISLKQQDKEKQNEVFSQIILTGYTVGYLSI